MKKNKTMVSEYLGRVKQELNNFNGIGAVGTVLLSAVTLFGATAFSSVVAGVVGGVGLLIAGSAIANAAVKALPPKQINPEEIVGQSLPIERIVEVAGSLQVLSVVGPSKAGKSTLIKAILAQEYPYQRTSGIHAWLAVAPSAPIQYYFLLDGAGGEYSDQFEIARKSDVLIVLYDHDESDDSEYFSQARLNILSNFSDQIIGFLENHKQRTT